MATENDKAWQRYIEAAGIGFDKPSYIIDAGELKKLAQREPRLMAKFDTPHQLPRPFQDSGYTLLPIRNGTYQLLPGSLFVEVPECYQLIDFKPIRPFPLFTAGRGYGEAQYVDQAFNDGLLGKFLSIEEMYLTIRGRERSGRFSFRMSDLDIDVDAVQIEVDAGYEALNVVVLVEAKIGKPGHFNIRQLYYPYRHFSQIVPQKRVRNVFLAYDIPSATYSLYEYGFADDYDPQSILLIQCGAYRLTSPERLTVYSLLDASFQTTNNIAPQADDLNKVFELLSVVEAGFNRSTEVADYFVFDRRQSSYYREAAEYLGLLYSSGGNYELTDLGVRALSTPPDGQLLFFAKAVVNSWIFIELIRRAGVERMFTDGDIDSVICSAEDRDGAQRYQGSTIPRRRQTITAWIKWLAEQVGCFRITDEGYHLQ